MCYKSIFICVFAIVTVNVVIMIFNIAVLKKKKFVRVFLILLLHFISFIFSNTFVRVRVSISKLFYFLRVSKETR